MPLTSNFTYGPDGCQGGEMMEDIAVVAGHGRL